MKIGKIILPLVICLVCVFASCENESFPPADAIHSQDILGKWKITSIKEVTIEGEVIKTTNYKSKNIIFDFVSTERMDINKDGYLPKGEYTYSYAPWSLSNQYFTDCVADIDTRNLEILFYDEQGKVTSVYRYNCYQVEGSNDMIISNPDKEETGFGERIYLVKIN